MACARAHSTYAAQATLLAELEDYQLQCWTRDEARHCERQLKRGSFSGLQRGSCSGLQPQRSAAAPRPQAVSSPHQAIRPRSPANSGVLARPNGRHSLGHLGHLSPTAPAPGAS